MSFASGAGFRGFLVGTSVGVYEPDPVPGGDGDSAGVEAPGPEL
jgi:hypothetical protein